MTPTSTTGPGSCRWTLEIAVSRYRDEHWQSHLVDDRARHSEVEVYDRAEPEDVDDFWDLGYELDYGRGEERLPAEDRQPLDEWRARFLPPPAAPSGPHSLLPVLRRFVDLRGQAIRLVGCLWNDSDS
ncbi:hypothetical protein ACFQ6N_37460 [Kitasatospora sp. NPDC056446]|uniref:hypothetical protein n=1 Tax=Kitasatospora sp. NPDC056446 TaxID=3345819 RepID=UPI00369ADFFA